ncbi:MAG: DNA adenine methylase [Bacteroidia bacterium]|jgi:DNA adenine methylase|nr:DNA adenine methylase [Bacteroidia bacterium]
MSTPEINLRSPLTIYGGKYRMVSYIMPLIYAADPVRYVETCAGGAQLTFALQPHKKEVLNDINNNLVAFFRVLKTNPDALARKVTVTPFSHAEFKRAREIFFSPKKYSDLERAWAAWTACTMGFARDPGSWGFDHHGKGERALKKRRENFEALKKQYSERLETVTIENEDVQAVIKRYDSPQTLFFIDPPYFNSDMGFYAGFSKEKFTQLLEQLAKIKGKFILTCYPSDVLEKFTTRQKWRTRKIIMKITVNNKPGNPTKNKTEVITWNFDESRSALNGIDGISHPAFFIARLLQLFASRH